MEKIKLSAKQLELFEKYQKEKEELSKLFAIVQQKENDFVTLVFDVAGKEFVEGTKFEDGCFVLPSPEEVAETKKSKPVKQLKKA